MSAIVIVIAIVVVLGVLALVFGGIFGVFHLGSRASRGGVEPPPAERRRGDPPFEGIERDTRG
jgi:hypothetical protein